MAVEIQFTIAPVSVPDWMATEDLRLPLSRFLPVFRPCASVGLLFSAAGPLPKAFSTRISIEIPGIQTGPKEPDSQHEGNTQSFYKRPGDVGTMVNVRADPASVWHSLFSAKQATCPVLSDPTVFNVLSFHMWATSAKCFKTL